MTAPLPPPRPPPLARRPGARSCGVCGRPTGTTYRPTFFGPWPNIWLCATASRWPGSPPNRFWDNAPEVFTHHDTTHCEHHRDAGDPAPLTDPAQVLPVYEATGLLFERRHGARLPRQPDHRSNLPALALLAQGLAAGGELAPALFSAQQPFRRCTAGPTAYA